MMIRNISLVLLAAFLGFSSRGQQMLVPPYIQPGNATGKEQKVLIWQTDSLPGNYKVEYFLNAPEHKTSLAKITFVTLYLNKKTTLLYRAALTGLKFDSDYTYHLTLDGQTIANELFATRTEKQQTKFAVFGDCGAGSPEQAAVAYQVYQQKPQFVLVTGDNVYQSGLESEYRKNFFPYYNAKEANILIGAPLMKSIPFYMILGNHDVYGSELDKTEDGLAYFYFNDLPLNGPFTESAVKATGPAERVKKFKSNTRSRYPKMSNFSYDYGNVHIACLDANTYINPLDPALVSWIKEDFRKSSADWKIVSYHHPGFSSSIAHYDYQIMRLLSPVLEQLGVDLVLTGHVHNYQRSLPLTFDPKKDASGSHYMVTDEGRVDGKFVIDEKYNGSSNTKPKGIIYIVTGSGGAGLYDPSFTNKPELWKHDPPENWVPFTAKFVSNIHSFTMIETDGKRLVLKQVDKNGVAFDQIAITK